VIWLYLYTHSSIHSCFTCSSNILTYSLIHLHIHWVTHTINHSLIHQRLYTSLLGPGLFFSFVIFVFTQTVGLLGRGIGPSQGLYLQTGQHKQIYIPWVGFEPMIQAFERLKTVHALDRAVTVIGNYPLSYRYNHLLTRPHTQSSESLSHSANQSRGQIYARPSYNLFQEWTDPCVTWCTERDCLEI
jgi:hypothetical protein